MSLQSRLKRIYRLIELRQWSSALDLARGLVADEPEAAAAWSALAEVQLGLGAAPEAAEAAARAVTLEPGRVDRIAFAARCRFAAHDWVAARALAEQGAAALDDHAPLYALDTLAGVFDALGDADCARVLYREAARRFPDHPRVLFNLATSLSRIEAVDEAEALFERVLERVPDDAEALHALALIRPQTPERNLLARLEQAIARKPPWPARARLEYARGKVLDDLERYDEAFAAFTSGARLLDAAFAEQAERDTDALAQAARWVAQGIADIAPDGSASGETGPVFVVGLPRSGSTLLERMLAAHPALTGAGEVSAFEDAVRAEAGGHDRLQILSRLAAGQWSPDPSRLAARYRDRLAARGLQTGGVIDKMPANIYWIPLILQEFPDAKVLLISRDSRDVGLALYTTLFLTGYFYSYDLTRIARHLRQMAECQVQWLTRLPPGRFRIVSYEALVNDARHELREVLGWLGLEWADQCLDFHRDRSPVHTASSHQVREPVHTRRIGRWRHYAAHLQPLLDALTED